MRDTHSFIIGWHCVRTRRSRGDTERKRDGWDETQGGAIDDQLEVAEQETSRRLFCCPFLMVSASDQTTFAGGSSN
jgi:hypothetical protein